MTRYWFVSKYRRNSKLALIAAVLAFVVILLGAYTRLTDAGLSCPDWPHCFGYLTAPHTSQQLTQAAEKYPSTPINVKKAWTEMTHRYFAGTEGLLVLFLAFSILMTRKAGDGKAALMGVLLIFILGTQVLLGMLTVTAKLKPVIVLSHLLTGLSLLSVLWWAYLELPLRQDEFLKRTPSTLVFWGWLAFLMVAIQISLGGWVSSHYAGLACVDFPYCNGQVLPPMQWDNLQGDLITIHMLHRIGALVTATYLSLFSIILLSQPAFRPLAFLILCLVVTQITLGILNVIWLRPIWIALLHHAVAVLLLLSTLTLLIKSYYQVWNQRYAY